MLLERIKMLPPFFYVSLNIVFFLLFISIDVLFFFLRELTYSHVVSCYVPELTIGPLHAFANP